MSPLEAEEFAGQLLRHFGVIGAKTTRYSRDGGIDVEGNDLVAQVKHQQNPVGVGVVREIYGVAVHKGKLGAVFAKSGFTKEAIAFAQSTEIVLITYLPKLTAQTKIAHALVDGGWPRLLEYRAKQDRS
jgi:HJR/Mrr/RecB family endonuclease